MKRLLIVVTWLLTTVITLFTTTTLYNLISQTRNINGLVNHEVGKFVGNSGTVMAYAALPTSVNDIKSAVLGADARPVTVNAYLETYNSPLVGKGEYLVKIADRYDVDPYLLIAIAQQESNLCKIIPDSSYNCWGWGVHSQGTLRFNSYEQAIETVAKGIKEEYLDKGYDTPEKIMRKYTPLSNGSWAYGINQFLDELNSGQF